MQRTHFEEAACSVARTLNLIGEWWTPLILRDIFYGVRRFDALREHLGISRKVLTNRLGVLVEHEIVKKVLYQENPKRYEYQLTERGQELFPVIVTLMNWGDKWLADGAGSPVVLLDRETGQPIQPKLVAADSGREITYEGVTVELGNEKYAAAWEQLQQARAISNRKM